MILSHREPKNHPSTPLRWGKEKADSKIHKSGEGMYFLNKRDREEKIKGFQKQTDVHTEKNAQREGCELSFIQGKLRIVAQETAFQIELLRNFPKDIGERSVYA